MTRQAPQVAINKMLELEKRLLQVLCQPLGEIEWQREVIVRLGNYKFRSIQHQVLFDCLKKIPRHQPEIFQELLLERLTRAGFPDLPDLGIKPYLEPNNIGKSKALAWVAMLAEAK